MAASVVVGVFKVVSILLDNELQEKLDYLLLPLFYGITAAMMNLWVLANPLTHAVKHRDRKVINLSSSYRSLEILVLTVVAITSFVLVSAAAE